MPRKLAAFKDRIRRAMRTKDEGEVLAAVSEMSKDPELLGEILSDSTRDEPEMTTPSSSGGTTQHFHFGSPPASDRRTRDEPEEPAGGGDMVSHQELEDVLARLDRLEQCMMAMAEAEEADAGGGEGGEGMDMRHDANGEEREMPEEMRREQEDRTRDGRDDVPPLPSHEEPSNTDRTRDRGRARVGDSSSMAAEFKDMISRAEVLVPGARHPTFDAARTAVATFDSMCTYRRQILDAAFKTNDGKAAITAVLGGQAPIFLKKSAMTCDAATAIFNGASAILMQAGRRNTDGGLFRSGSSPNEFGAAPANPATLNKRNREFWEKNSRATA